MVRLNSIVERLDMLPSRRAAELAGQVFGRLTVVCIYGHTAKHGIVWQCRCRCGATAYGLTEKLRGGETQSCGRPRHTRSSGRITH